MDAYLPYLIALAIGFVAGLRAMTAPAAIAWAAYLGWGGFTLTGTALSFMGSLVAVIVFSALAVFELISDQLPKTPSRKVPVQFATRLLMGGLTGACIGVVTQTLFAGIACGVVGAVLGTYIGAAFRAGLARAFGKDLPAALIEDVIAIGGAWLLLHGF